MDNLNGQAGEFETAADAGKGPEANVARWFKEIELAGKTEKPWRERAKDANCRYRDEAKNDGNGRYKGGGSRFNILYSNVQTICPAVYNQAPKPDIRRRFRDKDPIGKAASEMLERASSYVVDTTDLDRIMKLSNKDNQIVGRGLSRVDYKGFFGTDTDDRGDEYEQKEWEEVIIRHVNWEDFRHGPAALWEDVPWIAYRHKMTRDGMTDEFGSIGERVPLNYAPSVSEDDDGTEIDDIFKRAIVWEVWDKQSGKVIFIAEGLKDRPLAIRPDPLGLEGFFNCPRPLYATETSDTLTPIEPFRFYADQAKELDEITARITGVIKACKVRGIYDATLQEMANMMDSSENILSPSENVMQLMTSGGLEKAVWMFPIEKVAQVLVYLYQQRDQIKTVIYEITGIADIMRGSTAASETLGAQQLKAQFGTMRLDDMRRDIARYGRDIVRLIVEIISEHFSIETLRVMTGLDMPTDAEKQLAMVDAAQMEAQGQPIPRDIQKVLESPTWEEVMAVVSEDGPRTFRIDIETDSTVTGDIATEQQNMTEMLGGIASFVQAIGPAVESGYIPEESAKSLLSNAIRRFRMGREVEDALEELGTQDEEQPQGPSPEMMQMQQMMQQLQAENEQLKSDAIGKQQDREIQVAEKTKAAEQKDRELAIKEQEAAIKASQGQTDPVLIKQAEIALEREKMAFEAEQNRLDREAELAKVILSKQEGGEIIEGEAMDQAAIMLQTITEAMTAPKRVVYDDMGNVIGSETVVD